MNSTLEQKPDTSTVGKHQYSEDYFKSISGAALWDQIRPVGTRAQRQIQAQELPSHQLVDQFKLVHTTFKTEFTPSTATQGTKGKRTSDIFLDKMSRTADQKDIDASLDFMFREVDSWLRKQQFTNCDEVLHLVNVADLHEDLLIGLLTITFAARDRLDSRKKLFQSISSALEQRIGESEARRSLIGLS